MKHKQFKNAGEVRKHLKNNAGYVFVAVHVYESFNYVRAVKSDVMDYLLDVEDDTEISASLREDGAVFIG